MKKAFLIILGFILIGFSSFSQKDSFVINGILSGFPDSTLFILKNLDTGNTVDSAYTLDNKFIFKGKFSSEPNELWINARINKKFIYTYLFIGNENVTIKGNINDFPHSIEITGSKYQDNNNILTNLTKTEYFKMDSLLKIYYSLSDSLKNTRGKEILLERKKLFEKTDSINIDYIKKNINTHSALMTLFFYREKMSTDTLKKLYSKLSPELKKYKYGKILKTCITYEAPQIGDKAYDFIAADTSGKKHQLFNIKTPYILLNFSFYGCAGSSAASPFIREVDSLFKDSLTVVNVNTNEGKDMWLMSINYDKITYLSLWAEKGRYDDISIKYGLYATPTFLILDRNRIVLDRFSRFNENTLKDKLNKIIYNK